MDEQRRAKEELYRALQEQRRRQLTRKLFSYYPDEGRLARALYKKHTAFFEAGQKYLERLILAANRVGKTEGIGGYEVTLHLTGLYPPWWVGRRFEHPVSVWAVGDTTVTVRDIIQQKLWGKFLEPGTGLIPADCIVDRTMKRGVADAIDTIFVRHVSGGISEVTFKASSEGRESFQGTKKDIIWLDEEPPLDVYTECLLRITSTTGRFEDNGMTILTFTPLTGMSETVMHFLPSGLIQETATGTKFVLMASWDDAPHLDSQTRAALWAAIPPFQRDARSKGIPQLGAGAIFPVPESEYLVNPFQIPEHWPRAFGMDVGWKATAVPWAAIDRDNDIAYLTGEYLRGQAEASIHAAAIKARGDWIPGVIDPASRGRSQTDGQALLQQYIDLGLDLQVAHNGVESGLLKVWERLSTGRLKVFNTMQSWLTEARMYRRDEKGRVVKENDHLMDATRYLIVSGLDRAIVKPSGYGSRQDDEEFGSGRGGASWMG